MWKHVECVRVLLNADVELQAVDKDGHTASQLASQLARSPWPQEMLAHPIALPPWRYSLLLYGTLCNVRAGM